MEQKKAWQEEIEEKERKRRKKERIILILIPILLVGLFVGGWLLHPFWNLPKEQQKTGGIENEAIMMENSGNYNGAIDKYKEAIMKEKDEEKKCVYYVSISKLYHKLNKENETLTYLNYAKNLSNSNDKNFTECRYEILITEYLLYRNVESLKKAMEIAENTKNNKKRFYTYFYMANFYLSNKDFDNALSYYNKSISLKNSGDELTIGYDYIGIGSLYTYKKDYEGCIENLIKAKDYITKTNDKSELVDVYSRLGYCYLSKGDIKNAKIYYENAEKINEELNTVGMGKNIGQELAYLYLTIAQKNLEEENFENVIDLSLTAAKILEKNNNKDSAKAYNILCYAYFVNKKYNDAAECYSILKIENLDNDLDKFKAHKSKAELYEYIGKLYQGVEVEVRNINGTFVQIDKSIKRIDEAIEEYKKALKLASVLNLNVSEINYLNKKILELSEYKKQLIKT